MGVTEPVLNNKCVCHFQLWRIFIFNFGDLYPKPKEHMLAHSLFLHWDVKPKIWIMADS